MEDRELQKRIDAQRYPTIEGVLGQMVRDRRRRELPGERRRAPSGACHVRHEDLMTIRSVDDRTISLTGTSRFDIRDFGMEPPKVLMLKVEPEVDVRVEIVAVEDDDGQQDE